MSRTIVNGATCAFFKGGWLAISVRNNFLCFHAIFIILSFYLPFSQFSTTIFDRFSVYIFLVPTTRTPIDMIETKTKKKNQPRNTAECKTKEQVWTWGIFSADWQMTWTLSARIKKFHFEKLSAAIDDRFIARWTGARRICRAHMARMWTDCRWLHRTFFINDFAK